MEGKGIERHKEKNSDIFRSGKKSKPIQICNWFVDIKL